MKISDFSIQNPVKVTVGVILICLYGIIALFGVPVQLTPDVSKPKITIETRWPGAAPQEIEKEIVEKQEDELKSVEGMTDFQSECSDGQGEINMEFAVGTDMGKTVLDVANALQQIRDYPEDAEKPRIRTVNIDDSPIAWMSLIPTPPAREEVEAVIAPHPHLREVVAPALAGDEVDVAMLYRLSLSHRELKPLFAHRVDPTKLRNFAEDYLKAAFERVPGVANSNVYGGQELRMEVIVNPARLAARRITVPDLRRALVGENRDISAGDLWEEKSRVVIRTLGQFESVEAVENVIVAQRDGAPVYVKDVATVRLGHGKPQGIVRQRGVPSLAVNVQKEDSANVLDVMAGVKKKLAELNAGLLRTRGLQLMQVYDQTEYINSATRLVRNNIFVGGALAVMVLLLFLRSGRSTLVVALAIPICVVGTFLIVRVLGRSINVISLAGMSFAVGMVVDAAIVVLENIFSHYQRGEPPRMAASRGTTEVWGAVLASTLTTLAVFLPVVFVEEQAGQLFRDIAIAISAAVALSMLVSLTVIPSSAARLLAHRQKTDAPQQRRKTAAGRFVAAVVWLTERLQSGRISRRVIIGLCVLFFVGAVGMAPATNVDPSGTAFSWWPFLIPVPHWSGVLVALGVTALFAPLAFRARRLAVVLTMIVLSVGMSLRLMPGAEYLPEGNKNLVIGILLPPPGYNPDKLMELGTRVESRLRPHWEVRPGTPEAEKLGNLHIDNFFLVARGSMVFMGARCTDPARAGELIPLMQGATSDIPGLISSVSQSSLFERGISGGRRIDIEITGDDLGKIMGLGRRIMGQVSEMYPLESTGTSVRPTPSLDLASPELHIRRNREKAAQRGVNTVDLGYTINALVDGAYAGDYWHQGNKIDLVITAPTEFSSRTQDVAQLQIGTPTGEMLPLAAVADIQETTGPDRVLRIDRQRAVTIQVKPGRGIALEDAMRRISADVIDPIRRSGDLEGGRYQINLGGTADELNQMRAALGGSMLLAVVITYLLIAALYESFFYPLVIMVSVPMAAVGGFAGLQLLNVFKHQALDTLTMLGFIILVGTVVNNAILIVNQALVHIREQQMDHRTAVVESVRGRIRPIFMSTLTTVLGMTPLVLLPGAGSELYRGLGSVVLGGLIVSTVFTLILVPMLFTLMYELQQHLRTQFTFIRKSPSEAPAAEPAWTELAAQPSGNGGGDAAEVRRPR